MNRAPLQLETSLAHARGAYTVALQLGSNAQTAQVLLDTGSSSLAVRADCYCADGDRHLRATAWAQRIAYGRGAWAGPLLRSTIGFGHGHHQRRIDDGSFALIETGADSFVGADGILGLAYGGLNLAHDLGNWLQAQGTTPALTWPWPFQLDSVHAAEDFHHLLLAQPQVRPEPLFSALEREGIVADKFALLMPRALVHVIDDGASPAQLDRDPLNRGLLVIGGGEECGALYEPGFHDIRIVHDLYYNAHLIAVQVGDGAPIAAPSLATSDLAHYASNAIIDSGCSFIVLEHTLYAAVLAAFAQYDPAFVQLISDCQTAMAGQRGIANARIDPRRWPDLHFILESASGGEVRLLCSAAHYWQRNALHAGESWFLLMDQLSGWARQSILGLPFMSGHYCVFDRRSGSEGRLRMARAR